MKPHFSRIVRFGLAGLLLTLMLGLGGAYWWLGPEKKSVIPPPTPFDSPSEGESVALEQPNQIEARFFDYDGLVFWWDAIPNRLRLVSQETGPQSNMHLADYVGPDACQKCHQKNHEQWSMHPHKKMNAVAVEENVLGDFSGQQTLNYLGGQATFYRDNGEFRMKLARDGTELIYEVRETIGSRFFQYYIGRILEGRFAADHPYRHVNHVLPFGYHLDRRQWVPAVHVGTERRDGLRDDPFAPPPNPREGIDFTPYASNCSVCHTTFPLADDLLRKPNQLAKHTPVRLHWDMAAYFQHEHPELWGSIEKPADVTTKEINSFPQRLMNYEAQEHAVTLGISCEACHLGCKEHVDDPKIKPDFHPHSPLLLVQSATGKLESGRTHQNVNWACARCHVGGRPQFAAGMSTWNSVEYSDAMLGSCYSELKCIDCHAPHQAIGKKWTRTPPQDDTSCTRCHTKYESPQEVTRHTHHPADSSGSRCMNCHMPRINEGLQDVVRTHTIFSPTNSAMIEANHPNACNLCHTDQPIDWTLKHVKDWYGKSFSEEKIAKSYPKRDLPVAAGWMKSDYEPVRLVAAAAACKAQDRALLPDLLDLLDDPFLLNRQFTQNGLEEMLNIRLDTFGYQFYMSPEERVAPLKTIREKLLSEKP
jgi:predicted CXXCH cytochrome family protein